MKYKTLFRVLLKVIGVWLVVEGLAAVSWLMTTILGQDAGAALVMWAGQIAHASVELGLGLYLFFGGQWIADLAIPGNRPYCHECGYDLSKVTREICPECGTTFRREPDADPTPPPPQTPKTPRDS